MSDAREETPGVEDKFPGLPHIEPDPKIQLESWLPGNMTAAERTFNVQVRRAFIQALVARHPISTAQELREAVRRRFGAAPSHQIIMEDVRDLQIVRVPMPGGGQRLKLASQLGDANIEDELDERVRIDLLSMNRKNDLIYHEVNRGTASALTQLLNLMVDDGTQPGIIGITNDGDKWVVVHFKNGHDARVYERWMKPKMM